MKIHLLIAALAASVALAGSAEAAAKKGKKAVHRSHIGTMQARPQANHSDVYIGGEWVGRDPDPFIRSQMMRYPHGWDGPE